MQLPRGIGVWTERLKDLGATPEAIAHKAADVGLGHVAVKNADGRDERDHDLVAALGQGLRAVGIELWVWPFCGYNAGAHEDLCREEGTKHAEFALSVGAAGIVANVETESGSVAYRNSSRNAQAYMSGLRTGAPNVGVGMTSYWHKAYHPTMPWNSFLARAFNAPQVYWTIARMAPANMLAQSLATFGSLGVPPYPLGGDAQASPLTGPAIREFANACAAQSPPLASWGLYHWGGVIEWATVKDLCRKPPLPSLTVTGPAGPIACQPAVVNGSLWVNLGAVLPVLLGRELHFAGGTEGHPSRAMLRELAEGCGWRVDTTAWPEVRLVRGP